MPVENKAVIIIDLDDTLIDTTSGLSASSKETKNPCLVCGARDFLDKWQTAADIILLSAGKISRQAEKIEAVNIKDYMQRIALVSSPEGKASVLAGIVGAFKCEQRSIFVIGDRIDLEIRAGNILECITIRMLIPGGKYGGQKPRTAEETPKHVVNGFDELDKLLQELLC